MEAFAPLVLAGLDATQINPTDPNAPDSSCWRPPQHFDTPQAHVGSVWGNLDIPPETPLHSPQRRLLPIPKNLDIEASLDLETADADTQAVL